MDRFAKWVFDPQNPLLNFLDDHCEVGAKVIAKKFRCQPALIHEMWQAIGLGLGALTALIVGTIVALPIVLVGYVALKCGWEQK